MLSLKLSSMSAKYPVKLNIITAALFMVCHMTQCIVLTVQCFYLRRNKGHSVLLSTKFKRAAISFHRIRKSNIGNHYHKYATYLVPGIMEKFEEPDIIPP